MENKSVVTTPSPEDKPRNPYPSTTRFHNLKIIFFLAVMITLIAGIFIYINTTKSQKVPNTTPPQIQTPSPTVDPTTGWKLFSDTKLEISFRYPEKWIVRDNKNGTFTLHSPDFLQEEKNKNETQAAYGASMLLATYPNSKAPTINLETQTIPGTDITALKQLTSIEQSTIEFQPSISAEYAAVNAPEFVGSLARIVKDDKVYSFDMTYLSGYANVYQNVFPHILSSVRFFEKKQYALTKKLTDRSPDPEALRSLQDDKLIPLSCTPTFYPDEPNSYTYLDQRTGEYHTGSDDKYIRLINQLSAEEPKNQNFLEFIFCETEAGQLLAKYEIRGTETSTPEVILLEGGTVQTKKATLVSGKINYHCPNILGLTNDFILYLSCVDEEDGTETLYELDLPSETTVNLSQDS